MNFRVLDVGQDENSAGAVVKTHDEQRQQVLETM